MFVDEAHIKVRSGKGGNGSVSFRHEAHVPFGGPDGGDGGRGGDVLIVAERRLRTLLEFNYRTDFKADPGKAGAGTLKTGKSAKPLSIPVPPGTVIYDNDTGEQVADLIKPGDKLIAARGGTGGRGNKAFATASRQTPKFAELGMLAEEHHLRLELKLLADVGIIGFPNVGKSTLISVISAAKPKIANYPFTTLVPNLGVVKTPWGRVFVVADMPGLIEGASEGVGLGHQFLRHVERTQLLVHVLDIASVEGRDPLRDFEIIMAELAAHNERLAQLPQIVALNKTDLPDARENLSRCEEYFTGKGITASPISAATANGTTELVAQIGKLLDELSPAPDEFADVPKPTVYEMPGRTERPLKVRRAEEPGVFFVTGTEVEEAVARTDMDSHDALWWLQERLDKLGVLRWLEGLGANDKDTVIIGDFEMEYAAEGYHRFEEVV